MRERAPSLAYAFHNILLMEELASMPPGGYNARLITNINIILCSTKNCTATLRHHWLILRHRKLSWLSYISIITLMIIENRALWLVRSLALSRYNHRAVVITKARSFQNGSQIFWCFGVGNWSIPLFSRIIINVIILNQLVALGDVKIGE